MNEPEGRTADADRELHVLALNSGSSSLKFGLYRVASSRVQRLISGEAEGLGQGTGRFLVEDANGNTVHDEPAWLADRRTAVARIGQVLAESGMPAPQAIGHRVVHGGPTLRRHCRIDADVRRELGAAAAFAPLHMQAALSLIDEAHARFPGLLHVACFDTTFHQTMPDVARTLPLPATLRSLGIERYGFHGLSCESIVRQLAAEAAGVPRRLAIAHLGNGASVTAVLGGLSVDTSMGLTPTGGLIMGTRCGDLDPGVLTYLAREKNYDATMLEDLVDHRSGLLGISGVSSDMRALRAAAASNADARLAIAMFCQAVRKRLGAMCVVLDGIDMIVFTGGIGEHDEDVRADVCQGLSSIGVDFATAGDSTGRSAARCSVRALPSLEDEQIALHAWALG